MFLRASVARHKCSHFGVAGLPLAVTRDDAADSPVKIPKTREYQTKTRHRRRQSRSTGNAESRGKLQGGWNTAQPSPPQPLSQRARGEKGPALTLPKGRGEKGSALTLSQGRGDQFRSIEFDPRSSVCAVDALAPNTFHERLHVFFGRIGGQGTAWPDEKSAPGGHHGQHLPGLLLHHIGRSKPHHLGRIDPTRGTSSTRPWRRSTPPDAAASR